MISIPIRVYGRKNSINVQKVLWCCTELDLPVERIDRGGEFGGTATPEYRAMNPTGRVPTIDDNGFVLWESNAIVRYLAGRYGTGRLYPRDEQARATADRWMDWQLVHVWPVLQIVFLGLVRTAPAQRDHGAIETSLRRSAELFTLLDAHLKNNTYVNGDTFSMGDIPIGATTQRWFALDIQRPDLAALSAWHQRLKERPGFTEHVDLPLS
jgi:glutathione S-transferase